MIETGGFVEVVLININLVKVPSIRPILQKINKDNYKNKVFVFAR